MFNDDKIFRTIDIKNDKKIYDKLCKKILSGSIFVYPTDTIYGIGCDASNLESVENIRRIKKRDKRPFSIIAPSKGWIRDNCKVKSSNVKWLKKLPGKYTLIFDIRRKSSNLKSNIHNNDYLFNINKGFSTIGVRIPDSFISKLARILKIPIITTSVNISGRKNMTSIEDIDKNIKESIDFMIYDGKLMGKPSKLVFLDSDKKNVDNKKEIIVKR